MLRLLCLLLLLTACAKDDVHETRFIMGTLVEFTISGAKEAQAQKAIRLAAAEMQRIEDVFSIYGARENSVKRFNRSPVNTPLLLDDEVSRLLQISLDIQRASAGAFDPALGSLNLLWGFSHDPPADHPPSSDAIREARPPADCLHRAGKYWIRTDARCQLDFGAIAKGYAIDRGIALLKREGIHNAIINAGGDIRVIGNHQGKPWRIGLRHPRQPGGVLGSIEIRGDASVVTSGDYERFFIYKSKRYHHILNPETGRPARRSQSATVIAPSATIADAWSTALFVLGAQGLTYAETRQMPALIVDADGQTRMNAGMRKIFRAP